MVLIDNFKEQLITSIISNPIVYIPHFDFGYLDEVLMSIVNTRNDELNILELSKEDIYEFDNSLGLINIETKEFLEKGKKADLEATLSSFVFPHKDFNRAIFDGRGILVLKNVSEELNKASIQSLLQTFAFKYYRGLYDSTTRSYDPTTTIIIMDITPISEIPPLIERISSVVELPNHSEKDIKRLFDDLYMENDVEISNQHIDIDKNDILTEMTRTLQGLQLYEIKQILRSSLCRTGNKISSQTIKYALEGKKQIVKKSGIIEVIDSDITLEQVGGLERLVNDIQKKAIIFKNLTFAQSEKAKLPLPKGILILGMPGCGKSMIAKSIANAFNVSLLRLDVNRLMGQYVGQSESNLRRALQTAEAAHPCVLWIDEIEKAFAGNEGGHNDIVIRLMGHFLTWMQERKTAVYIVATANDVMRPELMRKGRFDEVYFVDFPNQKEAKIILDKKLKKYEDLDIYDFSQINESEKEKIVKAMFGNKYGGFSGSEIESLVNQVIEKAFLAYMEELSNKGKNKANYSVEIKPNDFMEIIKLMKPNVMSNQVGTNDSPTAIERIKKLQKNFISASMT